MPRQGAAVGRYRMSTHGRPQQSGPQGLHLLEPSSGCQLYKPSWNGQRTVWRAFPNRDPENPTQWDPFRLGDGIRDYGDWIRRYDVISGLGSNNYTFITQSPYDKTTTRGEHPVELLYRRIYTACDSNVGKPHWFSLVKSANASLSRIKDGYFSQGFLLEHKSQMLSPPPGLRIESDPVVLWMTKSAGEGLLKALDPPEEGGEPEGDITAFDGGKFILFQQAGTSGNRGGGPIKLDARGGNPKSSGIAENYYEVTLFDEYNGILPYYDGMEEVAAAHARPWDDILRVGTMEEQMHWICSAGIPADAIMYALYDDFGQYMSQAFLDKARQEADPQVQGGLPFKEDPKPATQSLADMAGATPTRPQATQASPAKFRVMPRPVQRVVAEPPFEPDEDLNQEVDAAFDPPPSSHADPERVAAAARALAEARRRRSENAAKKSSEG